MAIVHSQVRSGEGFSQVARRLAPPNITNTQATRFANDIAATNGLSINATLRIMYTKTDGITGSAEVPNVEVAWAVGELAPFAGKRYKLRLVAKDVADRESVFREGNLPVIQVLPAPAA